MARCNLREFFLMVAAISFVITFNINRVLILQRNPHELLQGLNISQPTLPQKKKEYWDKLNIFDVFNGNFQTIDFQYDDPRYYKGPILKGWEPGRSRRFQDYLPEEKPIFLNGESLFLWST